MSDPREQAKALFNSKKLRLTNYMESINKADEIVKNGDVFDILKDIEKHNTLSELLADSKYDISLFVMNKALQQINLTELHLDDDFQIKHYVIYEDFIIQISNKKNESIIFNKEHELYDELINKFEVVENINFIYKKLNQINDSDFKNTLTPFEKSYLDLEIFNGNMRKTYGSKEIVYVTEFDPDNDEHSEITIKRLSHWLPIIENFNQYSSK